MTNTLQTQSNKINSNRILIATFAVLAMVAFSFFIFIAYEHSDGTPYSTGYELGSMVNSLFTLSIFKNGLGLGSLIAVLVSWERIKSIRWAMLHAILSWCYVVYFALSRKGKV